MLKEFWLQESERQQKCGQFLGVKDTTAAVEIARKIRMQNDVGAGCAR